MWKIGEIYKEDKMRQRAEPCPMLMSTLKREKENCSNSTVFFYLLDSLRKIEQLWNGIQPFS